MATLEIAGRKVEVGDDFLKLSPEQQGAAVEEIAASMKPSVAGDVAKSAGVGVAKGVIGMLGLPGDVREMASAGASWAGQKMGLDPQRMQAAKDQAFEAARLNPLTSIFTQPGSQKIQKDVETVTGEFYKPQTVAGEYAKTLGEFVPAAAAGPGGVIRRAITQTALPAVTSETAGQLTKGTAAEPYARIAGALAAPAVATAGVRAVTPLPISPERQRMVNALANEGVDLTAGQATGSRGLRFAESHLTEIPGGGGRALELGERQKEQFTAAALRRVGETANRADTDTIDRAFTRIGQVFDDVAARNPMNGDRQLAQDLAQTIQTYGGLVNPSARAPIVQNTVQDIVDGLRNNGGSITGETYQALRSRLDKAARASRNDPQLQDALFGIRNALDDAMERSMTAAGNVDDVAALRNARREYRNLMVVERAAAAPGEDAALGLISPAQLRSAVSGQNKRDYVRGDGDFAELARAGAATMLPMPNSGTPGRIATQAFPATAGAVLGSMVGGPAGAGAGTIAGMMAANALPPLMGRAIMSPAGQAYLRNQLLPALPPSTQNERLIGALLRAQAAPRIEARP